MGGPRRSLSGSSGAGTKARGNPSKEERPSAKKFAPAQQDGWTAEKPVWACHRCLSNDMPTFPYSSMAELHRSCGLREDAPVPAAGMVVERPALPDTMPEHNVPRLEIEDCDEDVERECGEDSSISWAAAVLASGMLLRKDERGAYFKWLARTVLYANRPGTQGDSTVNAQARQQRKNRRASFSTALSNALPGLEGALGGKAPEAAGGRGPATATFGQLTAQATREEADEVAWERSARWTDDVLRSLSLDTGLPADKEEVGVVKVVPVNAMSGATQARRASFGMGFGLTKERRQSMSLGLYLAFHDKISVTGQP